MLYNRAPKLDRGRGVCARQGTGLGPPGLPFPHRPLPSFRGASFSSGLFCTLPTAVDTRTPSNEPRTHGNCEAVAGLAHFWDSFFSSPQPLLPPSLPPLPTSCVVPVKNRLRAICVCMGRSKDVVVGQWWSANMIDPSQSDFYFFYVRGRCCLCCVGTHIGLSI